MSAHQPSTPTPESSITTMDFYRAVRLLDAAHPDLPRTGSAYNPSQEPIRFGQKPELTFARTPIDSFLPATETTPPRLYVNFFGLFGPNGPLPLHLTEYARNRARHHGDPTFSAFCDIFHHRMIALFYRAWMVNHLAADLDRPDEQSFARYIGSFFGAANSDNVTGASSSQAPSSNFPAPDSPTARQRPIENRESKIENPTISLNAQLYYTGRLSNPVRNIEGLESIISEYFSIPAAIESHTGRWIPMPEDCHCRLGARSTSTTLGQTAIIGTRVWDTQLSFRLHLGPMRLADYRRLLPRGDSFRRLRAWIHTYAGEELYWDVRLILRADEVPMLHLNGAQQLGYTTWLHSTQPARPCGHLLVTPKN